MKNLPATVLSLLMVCLCVYSPSSAIAAQRGTNHAAAPSPAEVAPTDPRTSKELQALAKNGARKADKKDFAGAAADFTRYIELAPHDARGYSARGAAKHFGGDDAGAIVDCRQAISLTPKLASPYYTLALIDIAKENYLAAESNLNRVLESKPDEAEACYLRAVVRRRQGHDGEAAKDLAHVVALPAQSARGYITRGDAQNLLDHPAEAADNYRHALALGEHRAHVYYRLAYFETQAHRYATALEEARRSLRQPAGKEADYPQILHWTLQTRLGDPRRADSSLGLFCGETSHRRGRVGRSCRCILAGARNRGGILCAGVPW